MRRPTSSTPGSPPRLWPFATLGWPEQTRRCSPRHYPNDLLISGFDILFFWDARMAMQGMQFMGDVPWKRLYLHGLVRAADGQKMSKSKGNVVDPLGLIDQFGADALRFFMAAMESQGRDVKMDESRVEGYRNFATKLWNATRFCQANGIGASASVAAPAADVGGQQAGSSAKSSRRSAALDKAMADLRFDAAANAIYHFVVGHVLRLVPRADQGPDRRRDQGRRRLGARPDPGHAPPVHAVRHRGAVARAGRAAVRADRGASGREPEARASTRRPRPKSNG